eukprot:m.245274 g.245274  ORF g.245274 m.245274 type:complete len:292 (+) comp14651_c0_seq1:12-887(+)
MAGAARALVSTSWLADNLRGLAHGVRVIDASWHMPATGRSAIAEYRARHIPTALFFDIDGVSDHASPYPHMLPSSADFAKSMSELGVTNDDHVVVYDCSDFGLFSAARLWWTLRIFGHARVSVLDGGMAKWLAEGRPIDASSMAFRPSTFHASEINLDMVRTLPQVKASVAGKTELLLDARAAGRFEGRDPEPRPGLPSGHAPGARNIPFGSLIDPVNKTLLPPDQLRAIFARAGATPPARAFASCGSGMTACIIALAHHVAFPDAPAMAVYDGAWCEWAADRANPIVSNV